MIKPNSLLSYPAMIHSSSEMIIECKCSMLRYLFVPHSLLVTWRSLAQTSISADCPSGNVPTTFVRRLISRFNRSSVLFVRILVQCCSGKLIYVSVSEIYSSTLLAALVSFIFRSFSTTACAFSRVASRSS